MPKEPIEYTKDEELERKVVRVKESFGDKFNYVDLSQIAFVRQTRGGGKKIAYVRRIPEIFQVFAVYLYFLVIIADKFDLLPEDVKDKVIEHELKHFPVEFDGKLVDHDTKDFAEILEKYGINWVKPGEEK